MVTEFKPLVSIGMPTYNRADGYLPLALDSALEQDYPNLEIIVSDNASTDGTEELIRSKADSRIRYFRHAESIGGTNNFNFCVEQARGAYFLLLHDDDLIDPDFISTCVRALDGNLNVGVVRTGIRIIDGEGRVISESENSAGGLSFEGFLRAWFTGKTAHYIPNTLFNTEGLQRLGGFHSKRYLFQDGVALVRLASELGRVDVREIKASFRRHGENYGAHPSRARAWAEDCLYLRDLVMDLVGDTDRQGVFQDATRFFCRKAYRQASAVPSFVDRSRMYGQIYAMFGYRQLPPPLNPRNWVRVLRNNLGGSARLRRADG
jgi:glycosyltransferase involved in cell wall biosynthesis